MTRDSDRNGDSRQDRNGLGPKGESAGRQASPKYSPEDVGLVEKVGRIADRLVDQGDEPWPGSDSGRLHYWRDKAIKASNDLRAILTPYTVDEQDNGG